MEPPRQKWIARALLATGVILGLAWLAQLDFAQKISTNVLDLIPGKERSPELALVRSFASEQHARVALFALADADPARRAAASQAFLAALRQSPAFTEAVAMDDPTARNALGRHLFAQRFDLLLPGWLAARRAEYAASDRSRPWPEWLAEHTAAKLEAFLSQPEALAFQDLLPADPLLLLPGLVDQVRGIADPTAAQAGTTLIWARTRAAPLNPEGQAPVFAAVAAALAAARQSAPAVTLRWTAISRFAAENRTRIEGEMSSLNVISLLAVLGVAALCLRQMRQALHLAPVLLGALLGAWVATTLCFERVHVLVFVVGSLLGGVAIDYGFYLYLQPPRWPGEPYRKKAGRLLKPLLASALTTVLGFSLLWFSELPLIRQLGVFVSAGLICALATALLWFAQLEVSFMETRAFVRRRVAPAQQLRWRWPARALLLGAGAVALAGPWFLHWRDNIHDLEIPAPALHAEARELRALFGDTGRRTLYLTRGETPAEARTALTRFLDWHGRAFPGRAAASLGAAWPTPADRTALAEEAGGLAAFPALLHAALARHGFEAEAFARFDADWQAWRQGPPPDYDALARAFSGALRGPAALLLSTQPGACWFATVAEHPPGTEPPAELATVSLDQLESLNRLFSRYRLSALQLSAIGLGLVGLSVFVLYGLRRGIRIFAIPAGSCLFAFGLLGLTGQTLNLFHLLGAFLGVCLSHNYAIFSAENAARGDEPPPSIRLSALTTAVSFGVLALSQIPVVAALGTIVGLIVLTALLLVELEPLACAPPSGLCPPGDSTHGERFP